MENLKSLKLTEKGWGEARGSFSSIFEHMHHLEEAQLFAYSYGIEQDDRLIATLVDQNPKLSHVFFYQISLTDADLTSLAQLQQLANVRLFIGEKVTTAGVLTLLRGSSRNMIRKFAVRGENVDVDQVTREISQMCKERGTTFENREDGLYSHFSI